MSVAMLAFGRPWRGGSRIPCRSGGFWVRWGCPSLLALPIPAVSPFLSPVGRHPGIECTWLVLLGLHSEWLVPRCLQRADVGGCGPHQNPEASYWPLHQGYLCLCKIKALESECNHDSW